MPLKRGHVGGLQLHECSADMGLLQMNVECESTCPVCRSQKVHSSRFQGVLECALLRILNIHPYWCGACDSRFYLFAQPNFSRQNPEFD